MDQRQTATTAVNYQKGGEQMNEKMVYSVTEAAEQLSIGRTMTFHLISVGELGSLKIGNRRLASRLDLDEFITKRREAA